MFPYMFPFLVLQGRPYRLVIFLNEKDNQELQITDNVDIKQAQSSINAPVQTEVSLLYNPRTKVYSVKKVNFKFTKAVINFFLRTKSGKLQAGSTAIFLNKSIEGCTKETVPINKCSDRQASFQYSLTLEFIEEVDTSMSASMLKESQISENMRNSSISYGGNKLFENSRLYESIVQEVDEKTDQDWEKMSNDSKANSCASFISDLKQTQSSKNLVTNWRNPQGGNAFRKSRIQVSVEQGRKSAICQSNPSYQIKLSASKAQFQQQEQNRKLLSQKRINDLEKQNREMKESLNKIREQFQEKMLHEKTSLLKSQIQQTSLREELDMMKQKFSNLEQETKKMMFEKNEILNKYNTKQTETISQVKAKQKTLTLENKRLAEKSQKLQKQLTEQQEKCRQLDLKFRQQQISSSKNKKMIEYYQQEAMQLDEKVSELKLVEQELNNEIERLKDEISKRQENHQKEMLRQRKDLNNIKEFKENESKGLGQQLTSLKSQLKEKESEINALKKDFQTEKRRLNQQQSNLRQQKEKLQKQLKGLKQEIMLSLDNQNESNMKIKELEQNVRILQQEMKNIVRNRDEVLEDMQQKLEELNHQQFRLNEQNFEFEEKIVILENQIKEKNYSQKNLAERLEKVQKELSSKVQELQRIYEEYENTLQSSQAFTVELRDLKKQLGKREQTIKGLETKIQNLEASIIQEKGQNHELEVNSKLKIQEKDSIINELNDKIDKLEIMIQQKDQSSQVADDEINLIRESIAAQEKQNLQLKTQKNLLLKNLEQVNNNLAKSHVRIDQLSQQILKANEKIAIQSKRGQISLQSKSTLMQFISLFQTVFSAILAKDYQPNMVIPSGPSQNYKYALNNPRKILNSTPIKKNTIQQISDIKKLESYSYKNVQFATKFSLKLQQLQSYLSKIHKKLFQTEKTLENQMNEKEKYRIAEEKAAQEIIQLNNTINELNQEIQNTLNTQNKALQNLKNENSKVLNEAKKQNLQITRELTQLKKQMQRKNYQSVKTTNLQGELNKKIQTLSAQSKENLQKFQKSNQELSMKNKQINELQTTIREKAIEISKLKTRIAELEQELNKIKKQKDDLSKSLVNQQEQNSKSLLTIKDQKQLLLKKEESLKQAQKQLKVMEGKLFIQKRFSPQLSNFDNSQSSVSIATYSSKKIDPKKQAQYLPPTSGTFAYRKNYTSNKKIPQNQYESQSDQILKSEIQSLKQNISQKQKLNRQLQQKLKSAKQITFSKNISVPVKSQISKDEEVMREKILENLQAIQGILSVQQTGGRFDKYRLQLASLINKNKKIISDGSPFEQMRKICILIQKAKTNVQNKLKVQNEVKTVIIEEFMKIQAIVDEVMGK